MGYSGEAYFYAWARQRAQLVAAPFGAVKDVSILSAIAGNAVTLAMIAIALPVGRNLIPHDMVRYVYGSLAVIFGTSLPFLIFRGRCSRCRAPICGRCSGSTVCASSAGRSSWRWPGRWRCPACRSASGCSCRRGVCCSLACLCCPTRTSFSPILRS
ncbi:hypothetical protein MOP88_06395 [Sphingomonas sp. WKB10]|nr:hypothetical protein [Sphingomonas sp. WKB10]